MPAWRYDDDGDVTREESAETISFLTTTNIIHRFWRHSQAPLWMEKVDLSELQKEKLDFDRDVATSMANSYFTLFARSFSTLCGVMC